MRMWSEFMGRQRARYVPIPPDTHRRILPETLGKPVAKHVAFGMCFMCLWGEMAPLGAARGGRLERSCLCDETE